MSETTRSLELPLLQPAQAQKHVTVNEALTRIDALAQLALVSAEQTAPPAAPVEGDVYALPEGAQGAWAGQAGRLAIASNGGWVFATPKHGWRAFLRDRGVALVHDGTGWKAEPAATNAGGAAMRFEVLGFDHEIRAQTTHETSFVIPSHAMLFGVTARVIEPIGGSLSSWRLGVAGAYDRFGRGLGKAAGSYSEGVLSAPLTSYQDTRLAFSPEGGRFGGGVVRLAVHCLRLDLPHWPVS